MARVYEEIARALVAVENCRKSGNTEWQEKHTQRIHDTVRTYLPSGSGFDSGTQLEFTQSRPDKLVFITSFHHMDAYGMYDGWTEHTVTVTPSLSFGFDLRISGRDHNQIKEMMYEAFRQALEEEVETK